MQVPPFFKETPFFSSSTQDVNFVQQALPIPLLEPFVYPTPSIVPTCPNNSNSSYQPSSPLPLPPNDRLKLLVQKSFSSSISPLLFHTTSPGTRFTCNLHPLQFSKL